MNFIFKVPWASVSARRRGLREQLRTRIAACVGARQVEKLPSDLDAKPLNDRGHERRSQAPLKTTASFRAAQKCLRAPCRARDIWSAAFLYAQAGSTYLWQDIA